MLSEESEQVKSALARRYEELVAENREKEILDEFEREELVKEAQAIFSHGVTYKNLGLYSDLRFDEEKGMEVLKSVHTKLSASSIFDPEEEHRAFLCQRDWTEEYFLNGAGRLGGLCYFPTANHVFLTKSNVGLNALMSPRGRPIAAPRTLDYYIAHEFTHTLIGHFLGADGFQELPQWLSEGYPDVIGLGPDFTEAEAREAYDHRDPRVNGTMAEDYMKYDIMTAYYLKKQQGGVEELLKNCPSEREALEEVFGGP